MLRAGNMDNVCTVHHGDQSAFCLSSERNCWSVEPGARLVFSQYWHTLTRTLVIDEKKFLVRLARRNQLISIELFGFRRRRGYGCDVLPAVGLFEDRAFCSNNSHPLSVISVLHSEV